jgi:glycosyltransferase involved in cell wall biosynthesis
VTARRVAFAAAELLGYDRTGGAGTATTFLAVALARRGHDVDVLYVGRARERAMDPDWKPFYAENGVAVRVPQYGDERFDSPYFARMHAVERALAADPPDVVVAHEFWAPAYTALRLRQLGLGFERTLFVAFCHGTWRWTKDVNRNVRAHPDVLRESVIDQAGVELADVAVSPSAYLLDWMRDEGWLVPDPAFVIPYVTRSGATGETPPRAVQADGRVQRLAFFGRLEERKGIEAFIAALNALPPELLGQVELEFVGRATDAWTPERIPALLSEPALRALRRVTFETLLDQDEALARLSRPGTLAVMPSLGDNSPNTVYECLERGIPFLASNAGGIPELVAAADRARVLFEPTADGVAEALERVLATPSALEPARPNFDAATSLELWDRVLASEPRTIAPGAGPAVDVVVQRRSEQGISREPAPCGDADWVVVLDEDDVSSDDLVEILVRAQAASGADVVTCGAYVRGEDGCRVRRVFVGEPGGLGLLENGYGYAPLVRRSLLDGLELSWPVSGVDPDWPLLAALDALGARIVSVPLPLVTRPAPPPTLDTAADALLVVEELERVLPGELRSLARLAAGLAADRVHQPPAPEAGLGRRARSVLRRSLGGRVLTHA